MTDRPMPSIDVVIAIHHPGRPLDRALESVFHAAPPEVGAIVVCHGIDPASIEGMLADVPRARVRVLAFADGIRSPAGPFNAGIDASSADYVSVMGSDDFLQPGALRSWQRIAADRSPDAVIGEQQHQDGAFIASPLVRAGRTHDLDAVRDRLYYRVAPLGLLRRQYLNDHGLRFTEGAATGEDLVMSTLLWSYGRVELARGCPRYVIGADAADRTSYQPRPFRAVVDDVLGFLHEPRVAELPAPLRRSLAIRITRTTLLIAVRERRDPENWDAAQVQAARDVIARLEDFAPGFRAPFSRADRDLLDAVTRDPASAAGAGAARDRASRVRDLFPRNVLRTFDRESTATRYVVYALDRRRGRSTSAGAA